MIEQAGTGPKSTRYQADTHALLNRLRRIEGQVRGLQRIDAARFSSKEGSTKLQEATLAVARLVRS